MSETLHSTSAWDKLKGDGSLSNDFIDKRLARINNGESTWLPRDPDPSSKTQIYDFFKNGIRKARIDVSCEDDTIVAHELVGLDPQISNIFPDIEAAVAHVEGRFIDRG